MLMNSEKSTIKLNESRYLIITHKLFIGAGQDLYKYLKGLGADVVLIEHSFFSFPDRRTMETSFLNGIEVRKCGCDYKFLPDAMVYVKDFAASISRALRQKDTFDIAIGCGGFNALAACLLRFLGKTKKAIFYTIDFAPRRFDSRLLNNLYHQIDYFCVRHCDQTWNVSSRIAAGREKFNPDFKKEPSRQKVVPIGVWLNDCPDHREKYDHPTAVFIGHLTRQQGLHIVLESMPLILAKLPDFRLLIIGSGEYEGELKRISLRRGIEDSISFQGAITDSIRLSEIMRKAHLGLALYEELDESDTAYYADSTKIKTYLAMGLPVLLSDVPHNAREIERNNCGLVLSAEPDAISSGILDLMSNHAKFRDYSLNSLKYIQNYDWNKIFYDALSTIAN